MSPSVILKSSAPAKVNLSLKLVGKRADNYHLLDSVFVPVNFLFDELEIVLNDGKSSVKMSSNLPEMTDASANLCSKAAELYFKMTDIGVDCHIKLQKNIPIGAGLGGGSSDCGAVLKMLNDHYRKMTDAQLAETALTLGADVPFFLSGKISRIGGIGEKIEPLDCPFNGHLLIIFPPFSINTAWAYKNLDPSIIGHDPSKMTDILCSSLKNDDILTACRHLQNDFESLIFRKFPAYFIWRENLLANGAFHVGLSGSGSAFFAVFDDVEKLRSAAALFGEKYGGTLKMFYDQENL